MTVAERLHPDDLEEIARTVGDRVIAVIQAGAGGPQRKPARMTAGQVAKEYGVSDGWVRANAERLGAVPLGDGPRPRLRFDPDVVADRLSSCQQAGGRKKADRLQESPFSGSHATGHWAAAVICCP